jgi:nitrile hydratase
MSGHHEDRDHHHEAAPSFEEARTAAIEALLVEKGLVSEKEIDRVVSRFENDIGPMNGARVVARAWKDEEYKQRLLKNGKAAVEEVGIGGLNADLIVLENTAAVHNIVVCTLCSCYPWSLLGLPPTWYKSTAYRSRVVIDPRSVLREFRTDVDESVEVRVWDSNAEIRYLVLPERPRNTEGMSEQELAALVTRDAMIGVAKLDGVGQV